MNFDIILAQILLRERLFMFVYIIMCRLCCVSHSKKNVYLCFRDRYAFIQLFFLLSNSLSTTKYDKIIIPGSLLSLSFYKWRR